MKISKTPDNYCSLCEHFRIWGVVSGDCLQSKRKGLTYSAKACKKYKNSYDERKSVK